MTVLHGEPESSLCDIRLRKFHMTDDGLESCSETQGKLGGSENCYQIK